MTVRAAVGLGSNLGDRARHIREAIESLSSAGTLVALSPFYETDPIGGPEQGSYLNAVAVIDTSLSARALLDVCLRIEHEHGRERRERWGPRTLDLDILLFGDETVDSGGLTVPHPRLRERRFVLEPLVAAWPDAALPDGTRLAELLPAVADQSVRRIDGVAGSPVPRALTVAAMVVTIVGALGLWWLVDWLVG